MKSFEVQGDMHSSSEHCMTCAEGKQARILEFHAIEKLAAVHADVIGKMPCRSIGGSEWVLTIMDDNSRYSEIECLKSKAEVASACWEVLQRWERQTGCKVKVVRTDGGTEFLGSRKKNFLKAGIVH